MTEIIIDTNKDVILDNPGARYRIVRAANVRILRAASVDARGAEIDGDFNAREAHIDGDLDARWGRINGGLSAVGANIGGVLDATEANIGGTLYAREAHIDGDLDAQWAEIDGDLDAAGAEIGGGLDATEANIVGVLDATEANIVGILYASDANIGGDLDARGAEISGVKIGKPSDGEIALVRKILEKGDRLRMEAWHSECGTAHCLAGWAQVLAGRAPDPDSAISDGMEILPSFSHLFLASDRVARKECERLISEKRKDEEQDHENISRNR